MIKKAIFALVALMGVMLLGALAVALMSSEEKPATRPQTTNITAPDDGRDPWPRGAGTQRVDALFQRGRAESIGVQEIRYRKLDTRAADVSISLTTNTGPGGRLPFFLRPKRIAETFSLRSADDQVFEPTGRPRPRLVGTSYTVVLRYRRLPTRRLASAYKGETSGAKRMFLRTYSPTGAFDVILLPPAPPAGNDFAQRKKRTPQRGRDLTGRELDLDLNAQRLARGQSSLFDSRRARARARQQAQEIRQRAGEDNNRRNND